MDKYYENIKEYLINDELYSKVKDYSKERHRVITYYEIGKLLNEAGGKYGEGVIKKYSIKLTKELGKGYTFTALTRIKKFYNLCEKVATVSQQLTYGHYVELLPIKNINEIKYYIKAVENNNLSIRQLRERIKSKEYERLPLETRNKLINKEQLDVNDFVPNPILIKNKNNIDIVTEKALHMLILEDIESFMKELGNGFCFIGSEYKIKYKDTYNYIDLLLFNIEYNCYVVIELKITELKKQDIGQIQVYMNYIDKNLKKDTQDNTIGIIICKKDNRFVIKYCSDERISVREYLLV